MVEKSVIARLDPASVQAVARVLLVGGFVGAWCSLIHILTRSPVTPVPMLVVAAAVTAGTALSNRERPLAGSFNRWDESLALLGLAAFAHAVVGWILG